MTRRDFDESETPHDVTAWQLGELQDLLHALDHCADHLPVGCKLSRTVASLATICVQHVETVCNSYDAEGKANRLAAKARSDAPAPKARSEEPEADLARLLPPKLREAIREWAAEEIAAFDQGELDDQAAQVVQAARDADTPMDRATFQAIEQKHR